MAKFNPTPFTQEQYLDLIKEQIENLDAKHKVKLCAYVAEVGKKLMEEHTRLLGEYKLKMKARK